LPVSELVIVISETEHRRCEFHGKRGNHGSDRTRPRQEGVNIPKAHRVKEALQIADGSVVIWARNLRRRVRLASGLRTQQGEVQEMSETAVEISHHYRVTGDHSGKIIKVFNLVEETLLVGGVLFDPATNGMQYTQGFAPADPGWADHAQVHIDPNAPQIYHEQIGDEVPSDELHTLAVRARSAMSHFASMDTAPLRVWQRRIFSGSDEL